MRLTPYSCGAALACAVFAVGLAGCGDDPDEIVVQGTAAKGDPLGNATVTATCKAGTGSATSNSDGSYRVVVTDGQGPCLLKVTSGSSTFYSVATGTGSELNANITPLTTMLVSYLVNVPVSGSGVPASAEAWFALSATQSLLSVPSAVDSRIVNDFLPVVRTLATQGGQTLNLTSADFLHVAFSPTTGNPQDNILDQLVAANVVTSTGAQTPTTSATLATSASDDTPVPPQTTGTGGG